MPAKVATKKPAKKVVKKLAAKAAVKKAPSKRAAGETKKQAALRREPALAIFARNFSDLRKELGLSFSELYWETGLSKAFLIQLSHANRNVSIEVVERIADALGTTVSRLFTP